MEVRITENEITEGVVAYLNTRGFNLNAADVKIDYTVGRKNKGITALLVEGGNKAETKTEEAPKPTAGVDTPAQVVTSKPVEQEPVVQSELKPEAQAANPVETPAAPEAEAPVEPDQNAEPAAQASTTSLFQ